MRKDASRDARRARVMGRVDAMAISRLWVRGCDARRRERSAVARDERRVGRREANDVVHRASEEDDARRRRRRRARRRRCDDRAATDRTTHSRAAPTRATKVVMFYHG